MADGALFSKVGLQPKNRNVQKQPRPAYKISKGTLYGTLVDQTHSQNLIHFVDFAEFDKKNVLTIHYHTSLNAKVIPYTKRNNYNMFGSFGRARKKKLYSSQAQKPSAVERIHNLRSKQNLMRHMIMKPR